MPTASDQNGGSKRLPANWDDVRPGDLVLAQSKDPEDGWWKTIIVVKDGDACSLRYESAGRGRPMQRHRLALGLIYPGQDFQTGTSGKDNKADHPTYPKNWASISIGHTVLAKEDGPCEQFWEAKVVSLDDDTITLEWRDYPKLGSIVRSRHALGLLNPVPAAA